MIKPLHEQLRDQLMSRWNSTWDAKHGHWKKTMENAALMLGAPKYQLAEITKKAAGKLSEHGIRDELRQKLSGDIVLGRLKRDHAAVKTARETIAIKRAAVGKNAYDKADAVAALHRREIRDMFRALPLPEKFRLLGKDPLFAEAVFEMPARFTGVPEDKYELYRDQFIRGRHSAEITELDEASDVLYHVSVAIDAAIDEAKRESGLMPHQANQWVDGIAA